MGFWNPTFKVNVVPQSPEVLVVCDILNFENEGNVLTGNA
jgi:hypothetical protein